MYFYYTNRGAHIYLAPTAIPHAPPLRLHTFRVSACSRKCRILTVLQQTIYFFCFQAELLFLITKYTEILVITGISYKSSSKWIKCEKIIINMTVVVWNYLMSTSLMLRDFCMRSMLVIKALHRRPKRKACVCVCVWLVMMGWEHWLPTLVRSGQSV